MLYLKRLHHVSAFVDEMELSDESEEDAVDLLQALRQRAMTDDSAEGTGASSLVKTGSGTGTDLQMSGSLPSRELSKLESFDGAKDRFNLKFHR